MSLDLTYLGLNDLGRIHPNLSTPRLYEQIVRHSEGTISHLGPVVVNTGQYTGRSPDDKFIVSEASSQEDIWWGQVNQPFAEEHFDNILLRLQTYLQGRDLYVQDCYAGTDPQYSLSIRAITELAWHSLFARNMFLRESDPLRLGAFEPNWHVLYAPGFKAIPSQDHTRSETFILVHFRRRLILIGGTSYAGELKKAIFSILNYVLPKQGVLSMHCSANKNGKGETALFFGLSGTGKTTLSASSDRILIGDDEHGWSDAGIFNFEGGCYAKVIHLSAEAEPEIHAATRRFGTILENVVVDPGTRRVDLDDDLLTENTRASYPVNYIPNASPDGRGSHPKHLIMLTCDAFGVLPPVARLNPEQAMYHFISGYTAKVAGTERGIKEPRATFSPCFGAPFMALHPIHYARQLGEKVRRHQTRCWLVNTGWSAGAYGEGERISIAHTRAIVSAILDGALDNAACVPDPVFGIDVPAECPGVPSAVLQPRNTWKDAKAYDAKAGSLVRLFNEHFSDYEDHAPELKASGPGQGGP